MIELDSPITNVPLVGSNYSRLLKKLAVVTVEDLLHHYPSRYEDYSKIVKLNQLNAGETVTVIGRISSFHHRTTRKRGLSIQEAILEDETGKIKLIWFNQPFLRTAIKTGVELAAAGTADWSGRQLCFKSPEYEIISTVPARKGYSLSKGSIPYRSILYRSIPSKTLIHTGRLVPVYPETKGVSSKWLRSKTALLVGILDWYQGNYNLLPKIDEWLPSFILEKLSLANLAESLRSIHFPQIKSEIASAKKRLGFDEILNLQIQAQCRKSVWKNKGKAKTITQAGNNLKKYIASLPFDLTDDQQVVIDEIMSDLDKTTPMNRLLQGEVGSGKTVVAAAAAFVTIKAGYQVTFMAPTQVLADQHAETLNHLLTPFGIEVALLTGATKQIKSPRQGRGRRQSKVKSNIKKPDLIIGTHALIHKRAEKLIDKKRMALAIIDEQHRFGVLQRAKLIESGTSPHVLSMTATPIPRTVALTLYADLEVSTIKTMPVGRIPVKTWVVTEEKREAAYQWIAKQIIENKAQVFVVCPLIEQSDHESMKSIKAATVIYQQLSKQFPRLRLKLLHGKLKAQMKTKLLSEMRDKKIDMLVTTAVVEVGVDIPEATIMMIEGAERFGLSQLHQLRGRVGRADKKSYCLLLCGSGATETKRLKAMETSNNGLELANLDLKLRGGGELFSTKQHGFVMFKIADITDLPMIRYANNAAIKLVKEAGKYPLIQRKIDLWLETCVSDN